MSDISMKTTFAGAGALAGLIAAFLWFYAAWLPVPDNLDTFIAALQRISWWNTYAAIASGVTAGCAAAVFFGELRAK